MKKYISGFNFYPSFILLLTVAVLFSSCRRDDDEEDEQRIAVNQDFYELMYDWYYWWDEMPEVNPALYRSPYELLEALRFSPLDRWSYVSTRKEFEDFYVESKFIGYGFGSAWERDDTGNPSHLRVSFIYNSSDLFEKGVRRSWIIEKINGTTIQPGMNINQMLGPNDVGVSNSFVFRNPDGAEVPMTIQKKEVFMNTVLHREVIETGGKKAGYLVFKNFTIPSFEELEEAVNFFNAEGIDDLILDLRYNGGGQTNVANYLASIIGGDALAGEPFALYMYNEKKEAQNKTDNLSAVQPNLGLNRLITIATGATASASEMVINGLVPFLTEVIIIGDDTYGKPMGMNIWLHEDYAFAPVTFIIANSDGFGDYFDGLPADSYAGDDITRGFGDPEEASLKEALYFIETGSFTARLKKKSLFVQPYEQMTGIRRKIGAH
jgi:carboxyl-terminal processing protease